MEKDASGLWCGRQFCGHGYASRHTDAFRRKHRVGSRCESSGFSRMMASWDRIRFQSYELIFSESFSASRSTFSASKVSVVAAKRNQAFSLDRRKDGQSSSAPEDSSRSAKAFSRLALCLSMQDEWTNRPRARCAASNCQSATSTLMSLGCRESSRAARSRPVASGITLAFPTCSQVSSTSGAATSSCRSIWRGNASSGRPGSSLVESRGSDSTISCAASAIKAVFHSPLMTALRSVLSFQGALTIPGM